MKMTFTRTTHSWNDEDNPNALDFYRVLSSRYVNKI